MRKIFISIIISLLITNIIYAGSALEDKTKSAQEPVLKAIHKLNAPIKKLAPGYGSPDDNIADLVLGHSGITQGDKPITSDTSIGYPMGCAFYIKDNIEYMFVADEDNHRILVFEDVANLTNGAKAKYVIGQNTFYDSLPNQGVDIPSTERFFHPTDVCVDEEGNLFVPDYMNNRVLIFKKPLESDFIADIVLGQSSFDTNTANAGGISASSLYGPLSVAVDEEGNVFVADGDNNRILIYYDPIKTDTIADLVMGQDDFFSNTPKIENGFHTPYRVKIDPANNLYVTDYTNSRGLIFYDPLHQDFIPDKIIGQPDSTTNEQNYGGLGPESIRLPCSLGVDNFANLYMADWGNNRVLFYQRPLVEDTAADMVFGQSDFYTVQINPGGVSASTLYGAQRIDFDYEGNIYISDCYNRRILRYNVSQTDLVPIPWITTPKSGQSVSGNAVSIIVHMRGNTKDITMQVQYREQGDSIWNDLSDSITKKPYVLKWNTTEEYFEDNHYYEIRAVASNQAGDSAVSLTEIIKIDRTNPDIKEEDKGKGKKEKAIVFNPEKNNKIKLAPEIEMFFPAKIISSATKLNTTEYSSNPKNKKPEDISNPSEIKFMDISFENNENNFNDTIIIDIEYPDTDNNGIIDNTNSKETDVLIYYFNENNNEWDRVENYAINTDSNIITGYINHFTEFGLFAPQPEEKDNFSTMDTKFCIFEMYIKNDNILNKIRDIRDYFLNTKIGRILTNLYY